MEALIALLLLAGGIGFWGASLAARETALRGCTRACREMNLQFLDQTVNLAKIRHSRTSLGRLCFRRWYAFEFSVHGQERLSGTVCIQAGRIEYVHLDLPEGPVVSYPHGAPQMREL